MQSYVKRIFKSSMADHKANHAPHFAAWCEWAHHKKKPQTTTMISTARNGINYLFAEFLLLACFLFLIHAVLFLAINQRFFRPLNRIEMSENWENVFVFFFHLISFSFQNQAAHTFFIRSSSSWVLSVSNVSKYNINENQPALN